MSNFIKGGFYKHPNNTTVCFEVLNSVSLPNDETEVTLVWWRWYLGKVGYYIGMQQVFTKKNEYWLEWEKVA